jgi:molybdopterin synthase catalytic subunit
MPRLSILYFARSREITGVREEEAALPDGATTSSLWVWLLEKYPDLAALQETTIFALNQEYLEPGSIVSLNELDEVALIPPISGG